MSGSTPNLGPGGTEKPMIPTPKPLYPDTPWWAVLVAVMATAVVSVVATVYAMRSGASVPGMPSGMPAGASIFVDTLTYMPHIVLLFGVLADMFTYDGVWSIPSLVGVLSIPANYLMQFFWKGLEELWGTAKKVAATGTRPTTQPLTGGAVEPGQFFRAYDGCSVQGFESLATQYAPQTLVVTATVFCYYIFDTVRNRGATNAAAAIVMFSVIFLGQVGIISMTNDGNCAPESPYGHFTRAMMALFEGIVFGGSAYGIVQTYYPTRLPSSTISPFPRRSRSDLTMGPDGKMYDSDGYAYIVLPNGQTVPDLSTTQSQQAYASLLGQKLGTGQQATPGNCATST